MIYQAPQAPSRGGWYKLSQAPENGLLTVHKTRYDKHDLHSPARKGVQLQPGSRIFSLKPPHSSLCPTRQRFCTPLSCAGQSYPARMGWADDCGRIYLYYPICEVVDLLHCGGKRRSIPCGNCSMPDCGDSETRLWKTQPHFPQIL